MGTKNDFVTKNTGELFDSGKFSDVTFILNRKDGVEVLFPAHKMILASSSPVFNSMFYGDLKEKGDVRITDATSEGFAQFLQLFYKPEVTFTIENIAEVMRLIDKYDVSDAFKTVEVFLRANVTTENSCIFYQWAKSYDLSEDFIEELKTIICKKSKIALRSTTFKQLSEETVVEIFKWDCLSCDEKTVFDAAVVWAMNPERWGFSSGKVYINIKAELSEIINQIRFHRMTLNEFLDVLWKHPDLLETDDSDEIVAFIKTRRERQNSKIDFSVGKRSTDAFIKEKDKLLTIEAIDPDDFIYQSEIGFKDTNIEKISVHRVELTLSNSDELIHDYEKICMRFSNKSINSGKFGLCGLRLGYTVSIDFHRLWYNPLKKTYICELEKPLEFTPDKNVECFYLQLLHPCVPKLRPIDSYFQMSDTDDVECYTIDCSLNFAVAKIHVAIEGI